jgi:hypothetical protein
VLLAVLGVIAALGPGAISAFGTYLQIGLTVAAGSLFIFAWISEIKFFEARLAEGIAAKKCRRNTSLAYATPLYGSSGGCALA